MQITVIRRPGTKTCLLSTWWVDGFAQCVGIELPAVPLVPGGLRALAAGTYAVRTAYSPRFSGLTGKPTFKPRLFDLPGRTTLFGGRPLNECGVEIHSGNVVNSIPAGQPGGPKPGPYDPNDPHRTDAHGCLLTGTAFGADGHSTVNSRVAFEALNAKILAAEAAHEGIKLTIR
jgi:hypothetical protein